MGPLWQNEEQDLEFVAVEAWWASLKTAAVYSLSTGAARAHGCVSAVCFDLNLEAKIQIGVRPIARGHLYCIDHD